MTLTHWTICQDFQLPAENKSALEIISLILVRQFVDHFFKVFPLIRYIQRLIPWSTSTWFVRCDLLGHGLPGVAYFFYKCFVISRGGNVLLVVIFHVLKYEMIKTIPRGLSISYKGLLPSQNFIDGLHCCTYQFLTVYPSEETNEKQWKNPQCGSGYISWLEIGQEFISLSSPDAK